MHFETCVILCRPESSMNIGAVCRVMANTGLSDLRIICPENGNKNNYNEDEVLRLALSADYIWKNAQFFPHSAESVAAAGADCSALAGTTRRIGQKRNNYGETPEELCSNLDRFYGGRLGLVFGNERTGLTGKELAQCTFSINIPSDETFGSYNLSHAVLILTYSLFIGKKNISEKILEKPKASLQKIRNTSKEICAYLSALGMFKTGGRFENEGFFVKLLSSAGASDFEVEHLAGIFKKAYFLKNNEATGNNSLLI